MNKNRIENEKFPKERDLYNLKDTQLINCSFSGIEDGESALKESRNVNVINCVFDLRYPFWHAKNFSINHSTFNNTSRAGMWYGESGRIENISVTSVKFLRECKDVAILDSYLNSDEFGWKCADIKMKDCEIVSSYVFFDSKDISLNKVKFSGKYSFQYVENLLIENSELDTKDAFWHSKNVIVKNSVVKGEYLGWFSEGLTLINCKIIGIQPFCYCNKLVLKNCTMEKANDAFEYCDVDAEIIGHVDSIKNVKSGRVVCDSVGEIINEDQVYDCHGVVEIRK